MVDNKRFPAWMAKSCGIIVDRYKGVLIQLDAKRRVFVSLDAIFASLQREFWLVNSTDSTKKIVSNHVQSTRPSVHATHATKRPSVLIKKLSTV